MQTRSWCGLLLCSAALFAAATAEGQARGRVPHCPAVADTAARDSLGRRVVALQNSLEGGFYALVFAPAMLIGVQGTGCGDSVTVPFWRDHVTAYADGGAAIAGWHGAVSRSAEVEAIVRGVYLDARAEEYQYEDRTRMWEARAGHFWHPLPPLAGGVTVGWRGADDPPDGWAVRGLEIGFPLAIKGCGSRRPCTIVLDQTYVMDGRHFRLSPRYRFEMPLAAPMVARVNLDFKGVRNRSPLVGTLGLGLRL